MKKFLAGVLFSLFFASNAQALPYAFEVAYENHAWGYVAEGCLIDPSGHIYEYKYGHGATEPLKHLGTLSREDLKKGHELASKAQSGTWSEEPYAFDAGSREWRGADVYGTPVKLAQRGDFRGNNTAPEALELAKLLNQWCKIPADTTGLFDL